MSTRVLVILGALVALGAGGWLVADQFGAPEREVTTDSDKAYALYQAGRNHLERYALEEAADDFRAAAEADTNFAMAYLQLGQTLMRQGQTVMGKLNVRRAFEHRDQVSELERLWIELVDAQTSRKTDLALSIIDELTKRYPDHPWVLRLRGNVAREQARHEEALALYDRALELDPEAVDLHNMKGYTLLALGEYEKAVQSLQRYAFYAPDQANPHDSLGEAYFYTGRFEEATKEFLQALEIDPGFVWAGMHLADVLSVTGQVEKAHRIQDEFEPLMKDRGMIDWLRRSRLSTDLRAERWEDVITRADAILKEAEIMSEPTELTVFAYFTRTMAQLELGRLDTARKSIEELAEASDAYFASLARYDWFEKIAEIHRAVVTARLARAEGRPEDGIAPLADAIANSHLSPHELAYFRYQLSFAQYDAGRYEDAAATADASLEKIPTLPGLNYAAARARLKLGERDEALAHLRTYLEVMRFADEGLAPVARAQHMLQKIVPRS